MKIHILICIAVALLFASRSAAAEEKLVVVVAKGSPVTSISRGDLRRTFTGEQVTVAGRQLLPINANPGTPERSGFDRAVLGMSPEVAGRFWIDRKIRGQSAAPRAVPSAAYIVKIAAKLPNIIGYVPVSALTADVQAVAVDGVPYTDPRYSIATSGRP